MIIIGGNRSRGQTSRTFTVRTRERGGAGGGACPGETALSGTVRTRGFICGDTEVNRTLVSFSQLFTLKKKNRITLCPNYTRRAIKGIFSC